MKNFGQLRTVTVWLVLLGFLCGMMGPSVVMAKVERDIDMEGDPGDGDGVEGSGSSNSDSMFDSNSALIAGASLEPNIFSFHVIPIVVNGEIIFRIEIASEGCKR